MDVTTVFDWFGQVLGWGNVLLTLTGLATVVVTAWAWLRQHVRALREINRLGRKEVEHLGERLIAKMRADGYRPDLVIGIGKGGAFTGNWLASHFDSLPMEVIERRHGINPVSPIVFASIEKKFDYLRDAWPGRTRALVVEGASTRGNTLRAFRKLQQLYLAEWECKYCVFFDNRSSSFPVDYAGVVEDRVRQLYPWHKTDKYRNFLRKD
jgi:hypoxanthine phosphoribosyltransferase